MAYTNLLPRTKSFTGADCTLTDGVVNRVYTLPDTGIVSSGIDIIVNGTSLHQGLGLDFILSGEDITFLNPIFDANVIRVNYWISTSAPSGATLSTSTSLKYATPDMLAEIIGVKASVPSWDIAATPTNEAVGTGDGNVSVYYMDHQNILSDSLTVYSAGTALTETTDYAIDYDAGKITLTAAGKVACNTKAITSKYNYINNGMSNSYLITVLSRA
jgi:hypothetical protein